MDRTASKAHGFTEQIRLLPRARMFRDESVPWSFTSSSREATARAVYRARTSVGARVPRCSASVVVGELTVGARTRRRPRVRRRSCRFSSRGRLGVFLSRISPTAGARGPFHRGLLAPPADHAPSVGVSTRAIGLVAWVQRKRAACQAREPRWQRVARPRCASHFSRRRATDPHRPRREVAWLAPRRAEIGEEKATRTDEDRAKRKNEVNEMPERGRMAKNVAGAARPHRAGARISAGR